jgi:hypothetical protein
VEALAPAGKLVMPTEGWENSTLRTAFVHAGIRSDRAILLFFATKMLAAAGLPAMFMFWAGVSQAGLQFNSTLFILIWLAATGYYLPNLYLRHRVRVRQREVFEKLPDAIDLMTVMVEAGLGLDAGQRERRGGRARSSDRCTRCARSRHTAARDRAEECEQRFCDVVPRWWRRSRPCWCATGVPGLSARACRQMRKRQPGQRWSRRSARAMPRSPPASRHSMQ